MLSSPQSSLLSSLLSSLQPSLPSYLASSLQPIPPPPYNSSNINHPPICPLIRLLRTSHPIKPLHEHADPSQTLCAVLRVRQSASIFPSTQVPHCISSPEILSRSSTPASSSSSDLRAPASSPVEFQLFEFDITTSRVARGAKETCRQCC